MPSSPRTSRSSRLKNFIFGCTSHGARRGQGCLGFWSLSDWRRRGLVSEFNARRVRDLISLMEEYGGFG
jgi:hypothetical protein